MRLLVEAAAWQDLVQAKSEAIAAAQIEARRLEVEAAEHGADTTAQEAAVDAVKSACCRT